MILKLHLILVLLTVSFSASATLFNEVLKTDPLYNAYEQQIAGLKNDLKEKGEFEYSVSIFMNKKKYEKQSEIMVEFL